MTPRAGFCAVARVSREGSQVKWMALDGRRASMNCACAALLITGLAAGQPRVGALTQGCTAAETAELVAMGLSSCTIGRRLRWSRKCTRQYPRVAPGCIRRRPIDDSTPLES